MTTIVSAETHPPWVETRASSRRVYFPALDGFRAVAFLMVFAIHYLQLPWGFTGVDAFFVLSGFLITGVLFDSRDRPHRVRDFYLRRTLRIFPLYYGVVVLMVLLVPLFHWSWDWTWLLWPAYLGNFGRFLHAGLPGSALQRMADAQLVSPAFPTFPLYFGHFWSLCVEEQFYLLWPCVVFRVRDRRKLICICLAAVVVCPLLRASAHTFLPASMIDAQVLYRATPFRIDALLLGGLLALLRRGGNAQVLLAAARIGFPALVAVIVLWHVFHRAVWHSLAGYTYPAWQFTWGLSLADVFFACLLLMALEPGSLTFRAFDLKPLRWLGRISYGAYVFHDILHLPIIALVQRFTGHWRIGSATLALATTILLAWASFRWLEAPFLRLKDRWVRPEPSRAAAPAAPERWEQVA